MRRSMISSGVPLLAWFVILAKLINAESGTNGTNQNAEKNTPDEIVSLPAKTPLYTNDAFLAGEHTPVWYAEVDDQGKLTYRRDQNNTPPIVLGSVNYWDSIKNGVGFPVRKIGGVDSGHFTIPGELFAPKNTTNANLPFPGLIEKRSVSDNEVLYPSILVVMDYHEVFTKSDKNMKSFVEYLVLYALAFWGTVDSSLRNIQNPRVSLRIAGIIITKSRAASPYLTSNDGEDLFTTALSPMVNHWRSVSKQNTIISIGSYDIVAHMTDKDVSSLYTDWVSFFRKRTQTKVAAMEGPPCKLPDKIAGLIVYDNFAFDGLHRTIASMSKVLAGSDQSSTVKKSTRVIWTKKIVDTISNALKNASCMSAPKQQVPPGTPIAPILAGDLWPTGKQCESVDYEPDATSCWGASNAETRSNCTFLSCLSHRPGVAAVCVRVGLLTLDGSFCNAENTKICLDGLCVDKA